MDEPSNATSSFVPDDWFAIDHAKRVQFDNISSNAWPWKNLTHDHYQDLYESSFEAVRNFYFASHVVTNIFHVFGLIGNLFSLITVYYVKRHARSSNVFFSVIAAVAAFDFIFVVLSFSRRYAKGARSFSALVYFCVACGLGGICSLMSNMLTLVLAIDQFLTLSCPLSYQFENRPFRICAWTCFILISILVSLTRLYYAVDNYQYRSEYFASLRWFQSLRYFTDIVVPFVIAGTMVSVVVSICLIMMRRNKVKEHWSLSRSTSMDELYRKTRQHISLLVVLLCMYFLNQVGYLVYGCLYMWQGELSLSYFSSLDEINRYISINMWFEWARLFCDILESLSRSMSFYGYFLCNGHFYVNFMKALSCALETLLFHYCKRDPS